MTKSLVFLPRCSTTIRQIPITMALSWADVQRSDKFCPPRPEEQKIITLFQDLLDGSIDSESAAHTIATTHEPRLRQGEKISHHLFSPLSHAIIHPTTTLKNHQHIVKMLLHLSKLPDVIFVGEPCKKNGRTYWHSIPEFSFWFSQCALRQFPLLNHIPHLAELTKPQIPTPSKP